MAKQNVKRLLPVRVRKSELSESKLSCPFLKKNGQQCTVLQNYRNLTDHCRKMHGQEITVRCAVEQCRWECHVSLRCLTSHRSNLETHGVLVMSGGQDLDGTCKVVPYVEEEHGSLECHTAACAVTTLELTQYKAKMLKRVERAKAKSFEAWRVKTLAKYVACWEVDFAGEPRVTEDELFARAWRRKYGSKSESPSRKEFLASRAAAKKVVGKPVVAGVEPVPSPGKASFSNFKSQYNQLATKGQKDFDWAAFNALLKSSNMQISS
jgi:hypothetical protein